MSDCTDITCVPGERTTSYICEVGCAPAAPLPPLQLSWSEAELTGDGQTADVLFGGGRLPLTLEVTYIGGPDLAIAFDRPTVTLSVVGVLAETTTATIRATLRDAAGQEAVADLPVSVEPSVAAEIGIAHIGPSLAFPPVERSFLFDNGSPTGLSPDPGGFPPFTLQSPTIAEIYPAWDFPYGELIPPGDFYPDMYCTDILFSSPDIVHWVVVKLGGGVADNWVVTPNGPRASVGTIDIPSAIGTDQLEFEVVLTPPPEGEDPYGEPYEDSFTIVATVGGQELTARVFFGYTRGGS